MIVPTKQCSKLMLIIIVGYILPTIYTIYICYIYIYTSYQNWIPSYTLWLFNIAMENGPFINGLPIKNVIFRGYVK